MRFEGEATDGDRLVADGSVTRWYFFVPPGIIAIWMMVTLARLIVFVMLPTGLAEPELSVVTQGALELVDVLGWIGWISLFVFYFVLLSTKRRSGWWALGGFCCGLNLLLYTALLFLPPRRSRPTPPDNLEMNLFGADAQPRAARFALRSSFVCEGCDALLNYGVSECTECGERYTYLDGAAQVDESVRRHRPS